LPTLFISFFSMASAGLWIRQFVLFTKWGTVLLPAPCLLVWSLLMDCVRYFTGFQWDPPWYITTLYHNVITLSLMRIAVKGCREYYK
jgi:hypothetical protein